MLRQIRYAHTRNSFAEDLSLVMSNTDFLGAKVMRALSFFEVRERYGFDTYSVPVEVSKAPLVLNVSTGMVLACAGERLVRIPEMEYYVMHYHIMGVTYRDLIATCSERAYSDSDSEFTASTLSTIMPIWVIIDKTLVMILLAGPELATDQSLLALDSHGRRRQTLSRAV